MGSVVTICRLQAINTADSDTREVIEMHNVSQSFFWEGVQPTPHDTKNN